MYFSLFKETKNFDFYCMFFSAVCVAQGYHITFPGFARLRTKEAETFGLGLISKIRKKSLN